MSVTFIKLRYKRQFLLYECNSFEKKQSKTLKIWFISNSYKQLKPQRNSKGNCDIKLEFVWGLFAVFFRGMILLFYSIMRKGYIPPIPLPLPAKKWDLSLSIRKATSPLTFLQARPCYILTYLTLLAAGLKIRRYPLRNFFDLQNCKFSTLPLSSPPPHPPRIS